MPITTVTARGKALLARGSVEPPRRPQATQTIFPPHDPDDIEGLRERYRKANGGGPLWDERGSKPRSPQASIGAATPRASTFAATLSKAIKSKIGRKSRAVWEANAQARQQAFEGKAPARFTASGWRRRDTKYALPT